MKFFRSHGQGSHVRKSVEGSITKLATPAQISLAWMLGKKDDIVSIFGSRKVAQLEKRLLSAIKD